MAKTSGGATNLYELLFETATEGLIVTNRRGEICMANNQAGKMFGYEIEELKKLNVDDLIPKPLRDAHTHHRVGFVKSPHKRPMGKGLDLVGVRKDGTTVPVEISLNYYREGDEIMVMALIMDITDRKEKEDQIKLLNKTLEKRVEQRTHELEESQQLYRLIARNFPNGTINVFDRNFQYIFVEGAELYKNGITSERLMGKNYLKQLPAEVRPELEAHLKEVLDGKNVSFELKYEERNYLINAVGLADNHGQINRILLVEQNITERIEAEQKVKDALAKERQLNEMKSRFVSMASHEFRTPLSTVLSSLSLIEKYDLAGTIDKKLKHFQRIRGSVRHLTSILNDFLSLEKVETGKVTVNAINLNAFELFTEIIEQHQEMAKSRQTIHYDFTGDEEVFSDPNMLRIILSNLLSNSIKYSHDGKNIWVKAAINAGALSLSVKDEGIGIPYDDQENMFDRFFRAKNAINLEGTGLGLNTVQRYLQLLGGNIFFESEPHEGTTFHVNIPTQVKNE